MQRWAVVFEYHRRGAWVTKPRNEYTPWWCLK